MTPSSTADTARAARDDSAADTLRPLTELFAEQAARRPDALAVLGDGQRLTYGELADAAARLAGRLAALGLGPGDRVGVCLPHSPDLLVALLGILTTGASYVPLDLDYPPQRLEFITSDMALSHVVVSDETAGSCPARSACLVPVHEPDVARGEGPHERAAGRVPPRTPAGEDPACVIYTSGSTGRPKGVLIPHRALTNLALAAGEEFRLAPGDRFLVNLSAGFSGSLEELFPPLVHGAAVVIPAERQRLSTVDGLMACLRRHEVTALILTTALWHVVVRELADTGARFPTRVRLVGVSGERCHPEFLPLWARLQVPLVHIYGPTEYTATVTYYTLPAGARLPVGALLPIGKPIRGTRVHILDPDLHPVAEGAEGELFVGGDSLALGYHDRPELTAARFVPDPFAPDAPDTHRSRLYRTGDRVRRRPDGNLEFIGRVDDQIKIRGYRVEPGEIESALTRHPGVRQSVVTLAESAGGHRRLVAYVVPATDPGAAPPTDADLSAALASELPAYMVPATYVRIAAIPLNNHGKIDRAALPEPPGTRPGLEVPYRAPGTGSEAYLCALWAELLGIDEVGADDPFLSLGGDSLLAHRVLGRIRSDLRRHPEVRDVFAATTVRRLAAVVDATPSGTESAPLPGLASAKARRADFAERLGALSGLPVLGPLSESQSGIWFHGLLAPASTLYLTPWLCRLSGRLDHAALRNAFDVLVRRHEALRTAFANVDGEPAQVTGAPATLTIEDLREAPDPEAEALRRAEALGRTPMDTAKGPLLRMSLLRVGDEEHLLVCAAHHLVLDGRSQHVLLEQLADAYGRELTTPGRHPQQVETTTRHTDFAAWQTAFLDDPEAAAQLDWWRDQLDGCTPLWPAVHEAGSRSGLGDETGASVTFELGSPADLRRAAAAAGVTPYVVLLASFLSVLRRESGREDVAVGTPVLGRSLPEFRDVLGMFVNTLVMRPRLHDGMTHHEELDAVRQCVLDAFAHQDVPIDRIIAHTSAGTRRRVGENPFFNVLFNYERDTSQAVEWPGLALGPARDLPTGTAHTDLVLTVTEYPDRLEGRLDHRTARIDADTAARLAAACRSLLEHGRPGAPGAEGPPEPVPNT
ncbi:amino acid adenylation domain-containing protein [Streptomyces sp. NPDC090077]|uniref:amino acid adenylation domain-containing protein n=1 Tax=Streptomyces sp. NPDC090077 TaxID=3365938 RepID=UPI003829A45D